MPANFNKGGGVIMNINDKEKAKQVYKEGVNRYKVKDLSLAVLFALEKIANKKGDKAC